MSKFNHYADITSQFTPEHPVAQRCDSGTSVMLNMANRQQEDRKVVAPQPQEGQQPARVVYFPF